MTDDQYCAKITKNATLILSTLFESATAEFRAKQKLDILVIGAGFFPSFQSLVNVLSRTVPHLVDLNFFIVEPLKSETDRFETCQSSKGLSASNITIQYSIYNMDIKEYLENLHDTIFHIVYFEQPDLSPIGILHAKFGNANARLELLVRESVAYLRKAININSIIVASFLYRCDLTQLNNLINYSLNIQTKLTYLSGFNVDGSAYNSGLISVIDPEKLPKKKPEIIAAAIKKQDTYYFLLLIISITILICTPMPGRMFSGLLTVPLIFYHRYGVGGLFVKLVIIFTQLLILIGMVILNKNILY